MGKTVLLNEFEDSAKRFGWVVVRAYADAQLVSRLRDSTIPEALEALDYSSTEERKVTGVSIAGFGSVSTQLNKSAPVPTLLSRMRALADSARAHEAGVLITIDEVQAAPH